MRAWLARVPPPIVFAVPFVAGWLVQRRLWPEAGPPPAAVRVAGVGLIALAAALVLPAAIRFLTHRTTIVPGQEPSRMIVTGPYRWTRNPIYLADVLLYTGLALWLGAWAALALVPLPAWYVNALTIPMEEGHLAERFGAEFEAYRRRVRRWI